MERNSFYAYLFFVTSSFFWCTTYSHPWVHVYKKIFFDSDCVRNEKNKQVIFMRDTVQPFTQLIFSWNALRPLKGHFAFYVRVREKESRAWGKWYHAFDWGNGIQHSYSNKGDDTSSYCYVRLEMKAPKTADAFSIKVEPRNGASLAALYQLCVTTADFNAFTKESAETLVHHMKTIKLSGMPRYAQFTLNHPDNSKICSPVSCAMLVSYLMHRKVDPISFAAGVFDTGLLVYGSWPCNIAHCFDAAYGTHFFSLKRCNSFLDIYSQLKQGFPSVVSVRGVLPGALKPFPHGHLLVVTGWNEKTQTVTCHDPAALSSETVVKQYALSDFLTAWERSHRLTYWVEKNNILTKRSE
jgi:hypothetical protein